MCRLISYQTIVAVKNGDGEAMSRILRHYDNYINYYSMREYIDKHGRHRLDINEEVRQQILSKLVVAVVCNFNHTELPEGETLEE